MQRKPLLWELSGSHIFRKRLSVEQKLFCRCLDEVDRAEAIMAC